MESDPAKLSSPDYVERIDVTRAIIAVASAVYASDAPPDIIVSTKGTLQRTRVIDGTERAKITIASDDREVGFNSLKPDEEGVDF